MPALLRLVIACYGLLGSSPPQNLITSNLTTSKPHNLNIMFGIGFQEIVIIALVVLLFFGGKKIPELMKGLGKGVRSFKDAMNGKEAEDDEAKK